MAPFFTGFTRGIGGGGFGKRAEVGVPFEGGNQSETSLHSLVEKMATGLSNNVPSSTSSPGTLSINSISLGNYEYSLFSSPVTISSGWTPSTYFSTTKDTTSSFVIVDGNLTIDSGQTFIPPDRKLFLCLYVKGNVTVNGSISMTARGANHSGGGNSGGLVTEGNILVIPGTVTDHTNGGTVTNFTMSGTGGAGASPQTTGTAVQPNCNLRVGTVTPAPSSGPTVSTGGGGAGSLANPAGSTSGVGAPGTCFSGGAGGGGCNGSGTSTAGTPRGGAGGPAAGLNGNNGGGAGNPGGSGTYTGSTGTGGTLIIFATGTISGTGSIISNGSNGGGVGVFPTAGGGGSGGGCVVLISSTSASTSTITANGGLGDPSYSGCGGNGSVRKIGF